MKRKKVEFKNINLNRNKSLSINKNNEFFKKKINNI